MQVLQHPSVRCMLKLLLEEAELAIASARSRPGSSALPRSSSMDQVDLSAVADRIMLVSGPRPGSRRPFDVEPENVDEEVETPRTPSPRLSNPGFAPTLPEADILRGELAPSVKLAPAVASLRLKMQKAEAVSDSHIGAVTGRRVTLAPLDEAPSRRQPRKMQDFLQAAYFPSDQPLSEQATLPLPPLPPLKIPLLRFPVPPRLSSREASCRSREAMSSRREASSSRVQGYATGHATGHASGRGTNRHSSHSPSPQDFYVATLKLRSPSPFFPPAVPALNFLELESHKYALPALPSFPAAPPPSTRNRGFLQPLRRESSAPRLNAVPESSAPRLFRAHSAAGNAGMALGIVGNPLAPVPPLPAEAFLKLLEPKNGQLRMPVPGPFSLRVPSAGAASRGLRPRVSPLPLGAAAAQVASVATQRTARSIMRQKSAPIVASAR